MAARKNYTAAQIINGLRRAEVGLANGKSMKEVIRDLRGERADVLPVAEGVRGDEDESGEASEGVREGEPATEAGGGRSDGGQHDPEGSVKGKLLSPERRRRCVVRVQQRLGVSERRACEVLGQARSTQRRSREERG